MLNLNKLQKQYTTNTVYDQLKLPFDIGVIIPEDDSVRLLSQFVEGLDLSGLYATYQRVPVNPSPRCLLKIVLYSYMNRVFSSRAMELRCRRDINFMYLLDNAPVPDHATFARFRTLHFAPCAEEIMAEVTCFLMEAGEISKDAVFIDGTKIEACANKYTFVWKKSISRYQANLLDKLAGFVAECEILYGIRLIYKNTVKMKHVKKLRKKLYALKEEEGIVFVHGSGKRKSQLQKSIETLEEYMAKLKEYTKKLHTCGERSSCSKTDPDATFMRMKEDGMGKGVRPKAAYNIQHGVDSEYIVWLTAGQQPTDTNMLIPFLKEMKQYLPFQYKKIVTDPGYESEENYAWLSEEKQEAFIKPADYEQSKTRKYKNDIGRAGNMEYHAAEDTYTCHEGRTLAASEVKIETSKTGYKRETTIYSCADCSGCPQKKECIKGNHCNTPLEERNKNLYVSKKFNEYREESRKRIQSEEGKELRVNRSIQVEGSFGELKQDMGFRRFLCRGIQNVKAESILLAIAHNVNKLHHKIQDERTGKHLFPLKKSA